MQQHRTLAVPADRLLQCGGLSVSSEAVVAGDSDGAAELARNHVLRFEQEVRAHL